MSTAPTAHLRQVIVIPNRLVLCLLFVAFYHSHHQYMGVLAGMIYQELDGSFNPWAKTSNMKKMKKMK